MLFLVYPCFSVNGVINVALVEEEGEEDGGEAGVVCGSKSTSSNVVIDTATTTVNFSHLLGSLSASNPIVQYRMPMNAL